MTIRPFFEASASYRAICSLVPAWAQECRLLTVFFKRFHRGISSTVLVTVAWFGPSSGYENE